MFLARRLIFFGLQGINGDHVRQYRHVHKVSARCCSRSFVASVFPDHQQGVDPGFDKFPGTTVDTLSICLANPTSPWAYVYKASGNSLNADGTISVHLPNSSTGSYYIVVRYRNGVETWSAAPVSFAGGIVNYDFTTSAGQAFGNNEKQVSETGLVAIYSGDMTSISGPQDGYIDIWDNNDVFNKAQNGLFGYMKEDLSGDGFVDIWDMSIVFNNLQNGVGMNTPPNPQKKKIQGNGSLPLK